MRHTPPSLIETIRIRNGEAPLWYLHLRRLAVSCKALGVPLPGVLEVPKGGPDRVYRLEVGMRGMQVSERLVGPTTPVKLVVSKVAHHSYAYKTTDRAQFDRAGDAARAAGADDALLLTPGGFVAETSIWSVLWWEDDQLCGPAFELGILPGVGRARVTELVGKVEERRSTLRDLQGRPFILVNAVRGVVPVASLDGVPVPGSRETDAVARRFWP
ncbi:MAG: branched-chain amino acid aminotransferase [Gemmatimonadales bacterium]|jgi:branched-subunit amino acid aminotransferase/4-amino-4-deoxychorismate lyase|nr:branched-chain amino acid aminotransferase [Gemmatimonadales bacterium]